jgi:hypothetical protein
VPSPSLPRILLAVLCLLGVPVRARAQGAAASRLPDSTAAAWSPVDWQIFQDKVRWAVAQGLETIPAGDAIAQLGETFVGTPYRAATLEAPGAEHLIVNLHELDCVTFVETVLALTKFVRQDGVAALGDSLYARARYEGYLRDIRYRAGTIAGYASRLHYFSDWLATNAGAGHVAIITGQLGGIPDLRPVTFMTGHAASYPALQDSSTLATIQLVEARLNGGPPRSVIPKAAIAAIVNGIRDGDVIAAASTVDGLDVSHTGFAIWKEGRLHLLHAPLTGSPVEISPLPLAERIRTISNQWGIMVARVNDDWMPPAGSGPPAHDHHDH